MRRAIEAEEFVVNYQPIVDLKTGVVWGSEALVRWVHPERGLLDPSQFVSVAEETGLIVPLGERVFEEACRQAVKWQRERPDTDPLTVCVTSRPGSSGVTISQGPSKRPYDVPDSTHNA
jgi:EAL domain-containing protein (putative c-di-GMP-specific phosphodiesterase class I)